MTKDSPYCSSYTPKPDRKKVVLSNKKKHRGKKKTGRRGGKQRNKIWRYEEMDEKENEIKDGDRKILKEEVRKNNKMRGNNKNRIQERRRKMMKGTRGKHNRIEKEEVNKKRVMRKGVKGDQTKNKMGTGRRRYAKGRGKNNLKYGKRRRKKVMQEKESEQE